MHGDEGQDAAVGGGAREDGQHREQQQVGQRVAPPLAAARVGDPVQGGEQVGERHHGGSRTSVMPVNGARPPMIPRPSAAFTSRPRSEPNSPAQRARAAPVAARKANATATRECAGAAGAHASPAPALASRVMDTGKVSGGLDFLAISAAGVRSRAGALAAPAFLRNFDCSSPPIFSNPFRSPSNKSYIVARSVLQAGNTAL